MEPTVIAAVAVDNSAVTLAIIGLVGSVILALITATVTIVSLRISLGNRVAISEVKEDVAVVKVQSDGMIAKISALAQEAGKKIGKAEQRAETAEALPGNGEPIDVRIVKPDKAKPTIAKKT